jgi:hypothetical protein
MKLQLECLSKIRQMTFLAHREYHMRKVLEEGDRSISLSARPQAVKATSIGGYGDPFLTGFDDMTLFESKTICLVGRFPFWSGL